jgi:hypothetical protein
VTLKHHPSAALALQFGPDDLGVSNINLNVRRF